MSSGPEVNVEKRLTSTFQDGPGRYYLKAAKICGLPEEFSRFGCIDKRNAIQTQYESELIWLLDVDHWKKRNPAVFATSRRRGNYRRRRGYARRQHEIWLHRDWVQRDGQNGPDVEDWLQAEEEILGEILHETNR